MYDASSMRRFLLLLLLVVLPVQMSWAAVHACEHSIAVGDSGLVKLGAGELSTSSSLDDAPTKAADQGQSSVQACDGLHELMTERTDAVLEPAVTSFLYVRESVVRLRVVADRLDRPQWRAA